jgi:hypothetical protein
MRILCFGDSLALPREGCLYQETWVARLKSYFTDVDFICDFKGGMLVKDLCHSWSKYYQYSEAAVVIVQEGICDSAPRYLNDNNAFWKVIIKLFDKIKLSYIFWRIVKIGTRKPSCTYTSKEEFENRYDNLLKNMYDGGVECVVIIKIGHGAPSVTRKSVYYNSNVDKYNNIFEHLKKKYKEKLLLVDPLNQVDEDMFVDGYHCNGRGMSVVYKELSKVLKTIMTETSDKCY